MLFECKQREHYTLQSLSVDFRDVFCENSKSEFRISGVGLNRERRLCVNTWTRALTLIDESFHSETKEIVT